MNVEFFKMTRFWYINTVDKKSAHVPRPGYEVLPQYHNCHEIVFYDTGCSGVTTIDGVEYKFKAGDVAFIHKDTIHSEKHFSEGILHFFGFNFTDNHPKGLPANGLYSDIWDIKTVIYSMLKEQINQEPKYLDMLTLKTEEILLLIRRKSENMPASVKNMTFVKNYIHENLMQDITIESLAKMTGYSIAHFRKLFTETFGTSPKNYLMNERIETAVFLLKTTTLSCTEISYNCGFSNSAQMSKLIKSKYGYSPMHFKKK